jgi:hypothetical protein
LARWLLAYLPQVTGKEGPMTDSQTIAILLKHNHRLDDARCCAATLMDAGARVVFICLCSRQCRNGLWKIVPLFETTAPCDTSGPNLAGRYDLDHLSDAALVKLLKTADWVIPF